MISRGLLGSLCVLLGGWVVAVLPESTPLLQHSGLAALRSHHDTRMLGLAVILVGLALLSHAWVQLCRGVAEPSPATPAPGYAERLGLVRRASLIWVAPLMLAPPLFSRDGWSYAAQGVMAADGLSPYRYGPWVLEGPIREAVDPMWWFTPAPYGPLPVWWGAMLSHLTHDPLILVFGYRLLALAGVALLAWSLPRLAGWTGANPALATALVVASPMLLGNGVGGLHNDLLMVALMATALVVGVEKQWAWGAAVAGLAASVKVPGGLVCLAIVLATVPAMCTWQVRARRAGHVVGVAAAVLLGVGLVTGLGNGWISALGVPGSIGTVMTPSVVIGDAINVVVNHFGAHTHLAVDLLRRLGALAIVGVLTWIAARWPTGDRAGAVRALALALGVLVACGPVVQLWYLLWPLAFVAALPLSRRLQVAFIVGSITAAALAPLSLPVHTEFLVMARSATAFWVALGAVAGFVAWRRTRRPASSEDEAGRVPPGLGESRVPGVRERPADR